MGQHPDSEKVQTHGCSNATRLVNSTKDNAERVEKSGGVALVIAAMKAHPNIRRSMVALRSHARANMKNADP
jgi:hypothetical protein